MKTAAIILLLVVVFFYIFFLGEKDFSGNNSLPRTAVNTENESSVTVDQSGACGLLATDGRKGHVVTGNTNLTEEEWRKKLTPEQYSILREGQTERPFSGEYYESKKDGMYRCAACGAELFSSETKFDSGTGWPSFSDPVAKKNLIYREDNSYGMQRTEILCANCGSHLGHVFDDGPPSTGKRYCVNSLSLKLEEKKAAKKK